MAEPDALEMWLAALAAHGCRPTKHGHYWKAKCPAHNDVHESLSVQQHRDGVGVKCFKGCTFGDIVSALGIEHSTARRRAAASRRPSQRPAEPEPEQVPDPVALPSERQWTRYVYRDADGDIVLVVVRRDNRDGTKDIRQLTPHPSGEGWMWRGPRGLRPLYGLADVLNAPDARVMVVEGEKCVHAARAAVGGVVWVTWAGGTANWQRADWEPLSGREVSLIADGDEPGHKCMEGIADVLAGLGCKVWVTLPETDGTDIADWIEQGRDLSRIARSRRLWNPQDIDAADLEAAEAEAERVAEAVVADAERAAHMVLGRNEHFRILGTSNGRIVIQNSGEIETYSRGSLTAPGTLIGLAPQQWLIRMARDEVLQTKQARDLGDGLLRFAESQGTVDPHDYVGRGAVVMRGGQWDGEVAWHLGDRALIDGNEVRFDAEELDDCRTVWVSEARIDMWPSLDTSPRREIADAVMAYRWMTPDDGRRVLGWIVAALAAGALDWRPHVMLNAPASTGKSWLMRRVVRPLLGIGDGMLEPIADATAAYIARITAIGALPVVIDEAEPDEPWVHEVLRLMRISAGGEGVRGRADASSMGVVTQRPRFCAFLANTRVPVLPNADASRISMARFGGEVEDWGAVQSGIENAIDPLSARRCRSAIIRDSEAIARRAREISHELQAEGEGSREADIRGSLSAGWEWWGSDDVIVMANTAAEEHTDADNALLELLALTKRVDGSAERSVLTMLRSRWKSDQRAAADLFGVRRDDDDGLLMVPNHKGLRGELRRVRSRLAEDDLNRLLGQIDGVRRPSHAVQIGGSRGRALRFGADVLDRLGVVFDLFEPSAGDQDQQAIPMTDEEREF